MESKYKTAPMKQLTQICSENFSFSTRLALLTFYHKSFSSLSQALLVLLEYLQLASLIIISLNQHLYSQTDQDQSLSFQAMTYFPKLINPGYLLPFEKDWTASIAAICIIGLLSLLRYCLFLYILLASIKKWQCSQYLLEVWAWVFQLQGRVIYSIITSYWINLALEILKGSAMFTYGRHKAITALPIALTLIEFTFSFYLQFCFCSVIPNKNILTAKTNLLELLTLTHKFALQILQLALSLSPVANAWVIVSLNLILFLLRDIYYFKVVPFYKMRAILYVGGLLMMTTSLNVAYLLQTLIATASQKSNITFVIIVWIIMALLMVKATCNHLNNLIRDIMTSSMRSSIERLIHRVTITKQFREERRLACAQNSEYEWTHLMNMTIDANVKRFLHLETFSGDSIDINNKESRNRLFLHYLETLLKLFPKSELLKLHIIYFYVKKLRMYWRGMKMISELNGSEVPYIRLNASLLIYEAQEAIRAGHNKKLNLLEYMKAQTYIACLKAQILQHVKSQSSILQEVISETPDLGKIFQQAQSLDLSRAKLEKQIKFTIEAIPDYCIEPLKLIGQYHLLLNYSFTEYKKYHDLYERRYKRYEKYYTLDILCEENLYQPSNCYAVLSGQKSDVGKILICSKSIGDIYGGLASSYVGMELYSLALPCLTNFYAHYYKLVLENGEAALFNQIFHTYGFHRDGYVIQADSYMNIHPYTCGGLYFGLISRRVYSSNDFLFITENGELDCASEKVAKRLKTLFPLGQPRRNPIHISSISTKLDIVNKAFNMIAYPAKYPPKEEDDDETSQPNDDADESDLTLKEAQELYTAYTTEEQDIILYSNESNEDSFFRTSYNYACKVKNVFYGSILLKIVTLEEVKPSHYSKSPLLQKSRKKRDKPSKQKTLADDKTKMVDLAFFHDNNEKETKWIDDTEIAYNMTSHLTTRRELLPHKPEETLTKKNENPIPYTERNHDQFVKPSIYTFVDQQPSRMNSQVSNSRSFSETNQTQAINIKHIYKGASSIGRAHISKDAQIKQIVQAYSTALAINHHSNILKAFSASLCIVLICIFLSQISLRSFLQAGLDNLRMKKDILKSSQLRDYLLVNTQMYWFTLPFYSDEEFVEVNQLPPLEVFQHVVQDQVLQLANTNTALLRSTDSLDSTTRQALFQKNLKVYNNITEDQESDFVYLNTFEVIDRLVVISLNTIFTNFSEQTDEQKQANRLYIDAMNDLLLRSQSISASTFRSLDKVREEAFLKINICYVPPISLLTIFMLLTGIVITKLYFEEKKNMIALVRLNPQRIQQLVVSLESFKKALELEKDYDGKSLRRSLMPGNFGDGLTNRINYKKEQCLVPKCKVLRRRYLVYALRLIVFLSIGAWLVLYFSNIPRSWIDSARVQQDQLYFSNWMRLRISIDYTESLALISLNGTMVLENLSPTDQFAQMQRDYNKKKDGIFGTLLQDNKDHDSQLSNILLVDGCSSLSAEFKGLCDGLKVDIANPSYVQIFYKLQSILEDRYQMYMASDKTGYSLYSIIGETGDPLYLSTVVLIEQSRVISDIIDERYEHDYLRMKRRLDVNLGIYVSVFIILALIGWLYLFSRLLETSNDFKRVLRVFPGDLVLSSFILKTFLLRTSKDALNTVRHNI